MLLPHRYPFQLVSSADSGEDGSAKGSQVHLTATSGVHRGGAASAGRESSPFFYPPILGLEILAQAAMSCLRGEGNENAEVRGGYLGGVDGAEFLPALQKHPMVAGDTLWASVRTTAHFGRLLKVHGELERDGEVLVTADLILSLQGP